MANGALMPNDKRTQIDTMNFRYLLNIGSGF